MPADSKAQAPIEKDLEKDPADSPPLESYPEHLYIGDDIEVTERRGGVYMYDIEEKKVDEDKEDGRRGK